MTNTTQYANGWVPDPDGRGTWQLLYSCIFTLFICVYSAIHINIPRRGEPKNAQFWRKVKWAFIATFAPELVLYSAWKQYYMASCICRDLYEIQLLQAGLPIVRPKLRTTGLKGPLTDLWPSLAWYKLRNLRIRPIIHPSTYSKNLSSPAPHPTKLSLTYGFYVVMGGLVVDVSDVYDNVSCATLTAEGVLHYASKKGWERFSITDQTIRDKSKADNLAKVLVILQVSWTFLQCITRQIAGYPLTVLEVHILVHAACAMLMYALWFHKPLDVGDPSLVDVGLSPEDLALALMRSTSGSAYKPFTTLEPQTQFQTIYPEGIWEMLLLEGDQRAGTEAGFLIFDQDCLQSVQQGPSDSDSLTGSILDILADGQQIPKRRNTAGRQGQVSACLQDVGAPPPSGIVEAASLPPTDPGQLESQSHVRTVEQDATFHRKLDGEVAMVLMTGQTLTSGMGPAAFLTLRDEGIRSILRTGLARIPGGKRLVPPRLETHEVDPSLKLLLTAGGVSDSLHRYYADRLLWHKVAICLSRKDLLRWRRASISFGRERIADLQTSESIKKAERPQERHEDHEQEVPSEEYRLRSLKRSMDSSNYFVLRSRNFSLQAIGSMMYILAEDDRVQQAHRSIYPLIVVPAVYAGIHLALWNHDFPTNVERILWRIAGCALGAPFALLPPIYAFDVDEIKTNDLLRKKMPVMRHRSLKDLIFRIMVKALPVLKITEQVLKYSYMTVVVAAFPVYVLSRLYIVVEAFVSLRRVPIGVYETTTWAKYIPHF
ncbi:hypothetical protein PV11_09039 [Exophiala sideris]|uniref:Uncharacterized protein n=1 Tax=Exophiala sideris TaxID=1016849 RepID=A0A0D1Y8T9_9EURO|nr:hypothetical protein PV11_09039 [Exophiala sideris]